MIASTIASGLATRAPARVMAARKGAAVTSTAPSAACSGTPRMRCIPPARKARHTAAANGWRSRVTALDAGSKRAPEGGSGSMLREKGRRKVRPTAMWVSATASARADPPNSACRKVGRSRLADIDMHCCQLTTAVAELTTSRTARTAPSDTASASATPSRRPMTGESSAAAQPSSAAASLLSA